MKNIIIVILIIAICISGILIVGFDKYSTTYACKEDNTINTMEGYETVPGLLQGQDYIITWHSWFKKIYKTSYEVNNE